MSTTLHSIRFPNETDAYREARNELLEAEIKLRKQVEDVAALRRNLPLGGEVAEDFVFDEGATDLDDEQTVKQTRFSELFTPGKDTLAVYSFMYGPQMENACPYCTSLLDGLNVTANHASQKINLAVVAKSPIGRIREFARERGWLNLRLLSSANNTYNLDYQGETPDGGQLPSLNVFTRREGRVHHFYGAELLFVKPEPGQDPRHVDSIWPIWNLLDMTPEGRSTFQVKLTYGLSQISR
jgi:predicted dithiol-disulfide oxidoreductase (DUF899 family)